MPPIFRIKYQMCQTSWAGKSSKEGVARLEQEERKREIEKKKSFHLLIFSPKNYSPYVWPTKNFNMNFFSLIFHCPVAVWASKNIFLQSI